MDTLRYRVNFASDFLPKSKLVYKNWAIVYDYCFAYDSCIVYDDSIWMMIIDMFAYLKIKTAKGHASDQAPKSKEVQDLSWIQDFKICYLVIFTSVIYREKYFEGFGDQNTFIKNSEWIWLVFVL